jgi:hypothetical protein
MSKELTLRGFLLEMLAHSQLNVTKNILIILVILFNIFIFMVLLMKMNGAHIKVPVYFHFLEKDVLLYKRLLLIDL